MSFRAEQEPWCDGTESVRGPVTPGTSHAHICMPYWHGCRRCMADEDRYSITHPSLLCAGFSWCSNYPSTTQNVCRANRAFHLLSNDGSRLRWLDRSVWSPFAMNGREKDSPSSLRSYESIRICSHTDPNREPPVEGRVAVTLTKHADLSILHSFANHAAQVHTSIASLRRHRRLCWVLLETSWHGLHSGLRRSPRGSTPLTLGVSQERSLGARQADFNLAVGRISVCGAIYNLAFTADGFHAHHITSAEP